MISPRISATTSRTITLGVMLAALIASLLLSVQPARASTTFTVTNTNDSGVGSLRQAILDANATTGADTIEFAIAGSGVHYIVPDSQLPTLTGPVSINGYSQPGAQPNHKAVGNDAVLKIGINGAEAMNADGLVVEAANSTIKGLAINNWQHAGVRIDGSDATSNKIVGNFIGTDASGTNASANGVGVRVYEGLNNIVGGTTAAARNVISGNFGSGVGIGDGGPKIAGNKVIGNYIGTDATGTRDLGNGSHGVGTEDLTNTTTNSIIGGTTTGERNVISGNGNSGVGIFGSGNRVIGNYLGTDATGTRALKNDNSGVYVSGTNNTIGGTTAGVRNVISANGEEGVEINGATATGNRVLSNSIFANGGLGIDLGTNGLTANDPGDADTGANYLQNFPVLSSARKNSAGTTTVRGTLDSTSNSTFRVQFFSNPRGTDEGKTFLGSDIVSTDGSGDASFAFATKKPIRLGQYVTATATGPGGNTSEFSAPRRVVAS